MPQNSLAGPFRLTKAQVKPAAATLARAFQDDPQVAHYIPDATTRERLSPHIFEFFIRYGLFWGEVYAASANLEGVAVWLPHDKARATLWRTIPSGGVSPLCRLGARTTRRIRRTGRHVHSIRERHARFPHWYLQVIGVDPAFRGKGHAGRLLGSRLERIDRERLPCWVETQNVRNVALYERFGFRCVQEGVIPGTAVHLWSMLRDPS